MGTLIKVMPPAQAPDPGGHQAQVTPRCLATRPQQMAPLARAGKGLAGTRCMLSCPACLPAALWSQFVPALMWARPLKGPPPAPARLWAKPDGALPKSLALRDRVPITGIFPASEGGELVGDGAIHQHSPRRVAWATEEVVLTTGLRGDGSPPFR